MDEFDQMVLRDFLAENWSAWVNHCEQRGIDPQDIYVEVGGERE